MLGFASGFGAKCLAWILLLGGAFSAAALSPSSALSDYSHQSWNMENGLPQNGVQALAQASDGFLWLGTEAGLVRFDGVEFTTVGRDSGSELPGNDIRCLAAAADGSLWVGTNAGLARWRAGRFTVLPQFGSAPAHAIRGLAKSGDGTLWVLTDNGVSEVSATGPVAVRSPFGDSLITNIATDGMGGMWAFAQNRVAIYRGGRWRGPSGTGVQEQLRFLESSGTGLSVSDGDTGQGKTSSAKELTAQGGREIPTGRIQTLLAGRGSSLWIGTSAGLMRWSRGRLERFPLTDSLATASILALTEDREGNLWVGTENGLDVLRDRRFHILDERQGLSSGAVTTVAGGADGALWVGTQGDGVNVLRRAADGAWRVTDRYSVKNGLASDVILSIATANNGDTWVGTPDGLNRIRGAGGVQTFTSADGLPDDLVRSLLVDSDGTLWAGTRHGVAHCMLSHGGVSALGRIELLTRASGLGSDLVGAVSRAHDGDLWVATLAGLSRVRDGRVTNFTTADGLSGNVITALLARPGAPLLVGTEAGWNVWDARRFSAPGDSMLRGQSVHAIVEDDQGRIWFATGKGIARASCSDVTSTCSQWIQFGVADGLPDRETGGIGHPSAWRAHDGSLWFATAKGLVEVDPARFSVNEVPPPVSLERFVVDDVGQPIEGLDRQLRVPAGHSHFEFDYAGLSFVAPQKVKYRYKLDGFDRGWIEAGTRRAAYYTNIPPGHYTFRVRAANNDGVWDTAGASFAFELRPHYYQTIWFYVLAVMTLACGVMLALRQRLRHAKERYEVVLAERARIAREIHDTLAQGYVGVSIQLEILAELLRKDAKDTALRQLDETRNDVRRGLADARQSIWALRTQSGEARVLPIQLQQLVDSAAGSGLTVRFDVSGAYRVLPPETERELFRVAQEAIQNVRKHSGADLLSVELSYGIHEIALEVKDNGRGGATDGVASSDSQHFGLTGMKERAAAMGGTLTIESSPGAGTVIRLWAPARQRQRGGGT